MLLTTDCHGFKIRCDLKLRCLTASDRVRSGYDNRLVVSVSSGTILRHFNRKFHFNFLISATNVKQNWWIHLHSIFDSYIIIANWSYQNENLSCLVFIFLRYQWYLVSFSLICKEKCKLFFQSNSLHSKYDLPCPEPSLLRSAAQDERELLKRDWLFNQKCIRSLINPNFAHLRLRQVNWTELWR